MILEIRPNPPDLREASDTENSAVFAIKSFLRKEFKI